VVCPVSGMRTWGDGRQLGHENESVCILSGGVYVRRSTPVGL